MLMLIAFSVGNVWATDYQLVTSTSDLEAGANYVIGSAASGSGVFMAITTNTNNRKQTDAITITDGKITATESVLVLQLGGSTGAWTFLTTNYEGTDGYLANADSGTGNNCKVGSTERPFTISFDGEKAVITATAGNARNIIRYNSGSSCFACYASGQKDVYLYKEVTGDGSACATPTFSPAAGAVVSGTQVSISCSTEGAEIHYTTDGTDPTASSATYSAAIPVTSETTIKAIAVKAGLDNSSVASAAYTVLTPLTTMDQIFAAAGTTPTQVAITFNNWVVTGVKSSNAYVTDGTKGFIIYTSSHGFQVGDILSGTAVCKVQLYNGSAELTELTASKVTVNTGGSVSPVVLDAEGIAALTGANTGSVIKISGECTYESSKYYIAGVQLYNQLYSFSVSAGTNYECTGVYVLNTTYGNEILPRSAADIVAQTSVANPTFTPAAGEYTEVQNVTLSCATDGATVYYTTDGTNPTNESTAYSSAIEVGASMTIKAIAYKGEDHSEVVSAAYTINLPVDPETTCTWDLSAESYVADPEPTADLIQWTSTYVTMKAEKNGGSTGVNNYIPPTRTSTRFYTSNKITFIPANSKQITTIVITAASSGYATALKNATWTNATAAASDTEVTITASGSGNVSCVLGANTGITAVTVNYEPYVAPATYAVSFAAPEHGSLAIANGEDPIASGDEFVAGTELTVTAEPASGYLLDAIKVIETGSDPENDVTSTVLAGATLTVPAYAITVSATFVENVAPVATLTLSENGVEAPFAGEHHQGDVVNLPLTSSADCVKDFVGWSANASCAVAPEYAPGAEYTLVSTEQTLYAVYATASGSSYVKTALASIASGSEVVITEAKTVEEVTTIWAASNDKGTSAAPVAVVVTEDEGVLSSEATNIYWIITKDGDNFSFAPKGGTGKLYCTPTNNGVRVGEGENNLFSISSDYLYNNGTTRFIGVQGEADWRCYTSINSTISGQTLAFYKKTATYSDYATTCVAALADPVFTPAAGSYTEAKNIVITAEEGTIYYTTDGTDPTSSSTEYTAPIVLDENGTTTIKAIAISATSQSAIVTAAYTINMPLSTIPAIFAAATSTQTEVSIAMGSWVVSGVGTDLKTVYVTDGTNGFIIYNEEHGFEVGDILSGTITCELKKYRGAAELIGVTSSTTGLTVTKGGTITPAAVAPADLAGVNTGALISLSSWKYDGSNLTDGTTEIQPFTTIYDCSASFTTDNYYNVSGIYLQFDSKKEILPRSAADIEEVSLSDPEISYTPASATIELGEDLPGTVFANPHELAISYSSNNEAVATVSNTGVIALGTETGTAVITASFAGDATYAAANATYTITVSPASVSENVVVLAEHNSKFYAMSTTIASETAVAIEVEYDGTTVTVAKDADKDAIQWTKKTIGENITFQTKDEDKLYLRGTSGGATLSLNATACNWAWDGTNNCYVTGTRGFIYRISTNGFKNYGVSNLSNADYVAPQVIVIDPANIVVTEKADAELAYTPSEVTLTVGGAFTPAVLNYAEGFDGLAAVTYASNNEDVATVDESGVVSLVPDAIGTATITATFAGNSNYLAGSASYTITVNEAGDDLSGTWVLASSVAAGDKIIIMGANNADIYTMGKQNPNNRAAVASTLSDDVLNPGAATKVFTLVDAGGGKFAIQASNGNYLTSATSGTSNNLLEAADYDLDNAKWTISIEEGVASIVAAAGSKTVMQYNSGSTIFSCYGSASQKPVKIFKRDAAPEPAYTTVRSGLDCGRHYTVCLEKNVTAVKGATFWSLTYKNAAGTEAYLVQETVIEAGKPYIYQATADKLEVIYGTETEDEAGTNGALVGTFEGLSASQLNAINVEPNVVYMLFENQLRPIGANNHLDAHRAYVLYNLLQPVNAAPQIPGKKVKRMPMQGQTTTDCELTNAAEAPAKMLIDGQLFILRGEKMYDTTGRLVK